MYYACSNLYTFLLNYFIESKKNICILYFILRFLGFTFFVSVLLLVQGWGQVFSSLFESKKKNLSHKLTSNHDTIFSMN